MNIEDVERAIQEAFPPSIYSGAVTPADGSPWTEELDDDLDLWQGLRGREWRAIPSEFIDQHAMDLPLLTPEAFAAFLPAWIMRSLHSLNWKNDVLVHTVYLLSPGNCENDDERTRLVMLNWWRAHIVPFSREQLDAIYMFLQFIVNTEAVKQLRDDAKDAIDALAPFMSRSDGGTG